MPGQSAGKAVVAFPGYRKAEQEKPKPKLDKIGRTPEQRAKERKDKDDELWEQMQPLIEARNSLSSMAHDLKACRNRLMRVMRDNGAKHIRALPNKSQPSIIKELQSPAVPNVARKKFPRVNDCIVPECGKVYVQQNEGHRMCAKCRIANRGWN